jgi:hypothetical protein
VIRLGSREWFARVKKLEQEELEGGQTAWWWLSFVDETGFLGVCYVLAFGMLTAIKEAHRLGINPGGEVQASSIPLDQKPPNKWLNRLLSKSDIDEMNKETT